MRNKFCESSYTHYIIQQSMAAICTCLFYIIDLIIMYKTNRRSRRCPALFVCPTVSLYMSVCLSIFVCLHSRSTVRTITRKTDIVWNNCSFKLKAEICGLSVLTDMRGKTIRDNHLTCQTLVYRCRRVVWNDSESVLNRLTFLCAIFISHGSCHFKLFINTQNPITF